MMAGIVPFAAVPSHHAPRAGRPAVFLDRDGTINDNVFNPVSGRWEAPLSVDQLKLADGAAAALRDLQDAEYALILVSNQPNYALGKASLESMQAIHNALVAALEREGVRLTAAYYCHHHPNGHVEGLGGPCICRKPSPHFLQAAQTRYGIDLAGSWMVGDRGSDVGCGRAAGARTIFLTSPGHIPVKEGEPPADREAKNLAAAVSIILQMPR